MCSSIFGQSVRSSWFVMVIQVCSSYSLSCQLTQPEDRKEIHAWLMATHPWCCGEFRDRKLRTVVNTNCSLTTVSAIDALPQLYPTTFPVCECTKYNFSRLEDKWSRCRPPERSSSEKSLTLTQDFNVMQGTNVCFEKHRERGKWRDDRWHDHTQWRWQEGDQHKVWITSWRKGLQEAKSRTRRSQVRSRWRRPLTFSVVFLTNLSDGLTTKIRCLKTMKAEPAGSWLHLNKKIMCEVAWLTSAKL